MSWTYTGAPGATTVDQVRFLTGQLSSSDDLLLLDEEITWAIDTFGVYEGAAVCAESLAAQYADEAQRERVGGLEVQWVNRSAEYTKVARRIRSQASHVSSALPFAGGLSQAGKDTDRSNTDLVQPAFRRGMDDNFRIGDTDSLSTGT